MNTKQCSTCKQIRSTSEFRRDASRIDGLNTSCKSCCKHRAAIHYYKYPDRVRLRTKTRLKTHRMWLDRIKLDSGCLFCEEDTAICLDFHHLDSTDKEFGIAESLNRSWVDILKEIEKCVVVCSNCHKKIHAGLISVM